MVRERLKKIAKYYRMTTPTRAAWHSTTWRIIVILLAVVLCFYVNDYLQGKYYQVVETPSGIAILADKLFSWFMTGAVFGMLLVGLMNEGEFIIGLNKLTKNLESNAQAEIDKMLGSKKKKKR
jgi:hypothetical protein